MRGAIKVIFGTLREIEAIRLREQILTYAMMKTLSLSMLLGPSVEELMIWITWYSILGFFGAIVYLISQRLAYVSEQASLSYLFPSTIIVMEFSINFIIALNR
jgi:hypothetical protein